MNLVRVQLNLLCMLYRTESLQGNKQDKEHKITSTCNWRKAFRLSLVKRRTYSLSRKSQESLRDKIKILRLDKFVKPVRDQLNLLCVLYRIESLPGKKREQKLKIKSLGSKKSITLHSPWKLKTC